jgi:ABC-2 type transport system permease protein
VTLNQLLIGMISLILTLLAAVAVGYSFRGSAALFLLVGALTCLALVGITIITAAFIRTMFGLLTVGCIPFFILMFFSDCFMPLPRIELFRALGAQFCLNDLLATATASRLLGMILNFNAGIAEVAPELAWISLLTGCYLLAGVALFKRKFRY